MYIHTIRIEIRTVQSQAEWKDSGGSATFSNMLESVPNPPVPSHISPNCHTPYAMYESISTNFPESIREGDS